MPVGNRARMMWSRALLCIVVRIAILGEVSVMVTCDSIVQGRRVLLLLFPLSARDSGMFSLVTILIDFLTGLFSKMVSSALVSWVVTTVSFWG